MPTHSPTLTDSPWQAARSQLMLDPGVIQLNAGTCSPTPKPVFEAVHQLRCKQAASPTQFQWRDGWHLLLQSRQALASFLSVPQQNIALLENVTIALNIALHALSLPPGSHVLTTDHEYGSIVALLHRLARERNWSVITVKMPDDLHTPQQIVTALEAARTPHTRAILFSHVSSPSGLVFPALSICQWARQHQLVTVVDGAHAPGHLPLDLTSLDADFYASNCHKWLMAPASVGFLHVADRAKHLARSVISSWGHGYDPKSSEEPAFPGTSRWQYDLEFHGTIDRTPQMVMPQTLAFRQSLGPEQAIFNRVDALRNDLHAKMHALGLPPLFSANSGLCHALSAFLLPEPFQQSPSFMATAGNSITDSPSTRLQKHLWANHRIEVPITFCAGKVLLRVSTAWFNTTADIDALITALPAAMHHAIKA